MINKNKIKPSITISPDVADAVKKIAEENNRSFSNQIETIIIDWLRLKGMAEKQVNYSHNYEIG